MDFVSAVDQFWIGLVEKLRNRRGYAMDKRVGHSDKVVEW